MGVWLFRRELRRASLPQDAVDAAFAGVFGGLLGAKLWWAVEFSGSAPFLSLLLSRGGLSWFGGFIGGLAAGLAVIRLKRLPLLATLAAASPALAMGQAIGRVGCFLVGDDYGRPSELPWAVAFPEGLPPTTARVHPTQLYEALALVPLAAAIIGWRRHARRDEFVLGWYLVSAGAIRFAIEFVRANERVLGPLTVAHLASLAVVAVGALILRPRQPT